jgi:hypothetical protein
MHIDKRKYAYLVEIENKNKQTNARESYIALVDEDNRVYMFTDWELRNAEIRALKNKEDIEIIDVNYEVIIEA